MKHVTKIIILFTSFLAASVYAYPRQSMGQYMNYPYADGTTGPAVYAGGFAGLTNYTGTSYYSDGSTASSSTQSGAIGFMGQVGVMLNQYFGVEVGYARFGNLTTTYRSGGRKTQENDYFTAPMVNIKGVFPFGNGFNLFGKIGFSSIRAHSNISDFNGKQYSGLNLGLGLGYYFTPNVEGTFEYFSSMINSKANTSFTPSMFGFGINMHV